MDWTVSSYAIAYYGIIIYMNISLGINYLSRKNVNLGKQIK